MKNAKVLILALSFALSLILPAFVNAEREGGSSGYDVVVSTRTLERGHILSATDVELKSVKRNAPRAARDISSVLGMVLKRTIGRNTTIKRDYLESASNRVKGVNRGSEVLIIVEGEGLRITADGRLRESAKVGELVKIENLSSGKIITGRLIDENTAVVNF